MADQTDEKTQGQATEQQETSYEQEYEAALNEGETVPEGEKQEPEKQPEAFDKEAFAKEVRDQTKKELEGLFVSRLNASAEDNRRLKTALEALGKDVADLKPVVDPLEQAFAGIDLEKLPEEQKVYFTDPNFQAAMRLMFGQVINHYAPKKDAPVQPSAEQQAENMARAKAHADAVESEVKKVHVDVNEIYSSPEFAEWYKARGPKFVLFNGQPIADLISPNAKDHIDLVNEYKLANKAKLEAAAEEARKKAASDALAGHGAAKGGAPAGGGDDDGLSPDDILDMSDEDWQKHRRKIMLQR